MSVDIRSSSESSVDDFIELGRTLYGEDVRAMYYLRDLRTAHDYCIKNPHITLTTFEGKKGERLVSHIALIEDTRLPKGEAFFGFFEMKQDTEAFTQLWEKLCDTARNKGVRVLKGPISGSIWHQYRVIKSTDGSAPFITEPLSKSYYYDLLTSVAPTREITYYSARRRGYTQVLKILGAISYYAKEAAGFSVERVANVDAQLLTRIGDLGRASFSESWGYTELTNEDLFDLYTGDKFSAHLNSLYVLLYNNVVIGFCSTASDDESTLVCKTICIAPEYQGKGLGNMLAYRVHKDAQSEGIDTIIYALIRDGNAIQKFPKEGTELFRSYAVFEINL